MHTFATARTVPALLVLALLASACVPNGPAAPPAAATPAVFLSEAGALRPIANGGRVPIADGSVEVSFAPYPPETTTQLVVVVRDATGRAVPADVRVLYEMLGMDHPAASALALRDGERHRATIGLPMPGAWRFVLRVGRAGTATSLLFIVPERP